MCNICVYYVCLHNVLVSYVCVHYVCVCNVCVYIMSVCVICMCISCLYVCVCYLFVICMLWQPHTVGLTPCQHPEQRPLRGEVVKGRYLPFSAAALDRSSSGPGQSWALGPPAGGRRKRSFKGWAQGRRGGTRVGERCWTNASCWVNVGAFSNRTEPEASGAISTPTSTTGLTRTPLTLMPHCGRNPSYIIFSVFCVSCTI